ncbi:hypothetical protein U1Q18_031093, partial [Sarracenia purpurea var. burkii]
VSACVGRSGSASREDPFVERAVRDEVADEDARAGGDATVAEEANEVHVMNAGYGGNFRSEFSLAPPLPRSVSRRRKFRQLESPRKLEPTILFRATTETRPLLPRAPYSENLIGTPVTFRMKLHSIRISRPSETNIGGLLLRLLLARPFLGDRDLICRAWLPTLWFTARQFVEPKGETAGGQETRLLDQRSAALGRVETARHQLRDSCALGLLPRSHDLVIPRQVSACVGRSGSASREDPFVERAVRDEVADEEARAGGDATVAEEANEVHVMNAGYGGNFRFEFPLAPPLPRSVSRRRKFRRLESPRKLEPAILSRATTETRPLLPRAPYSENLIGTPATFRMKLHSNRISRPSETSWVSNSLFDG